MFSNAACAVLNNARGRMRAVALETTINHVTLAVLVVGDINFDDGIKGT
jgi:hypothetical protein